MAFEPAPWLVQTEETGERLAEPLGEAVRRFRDGSEHDMEHWVETLSRVMRRPLEDAVEEHRQLLQDIGFANGGARSGPAAQALQTAAEVAVREALEDTDDLRRTILEAEDDRGEDDETEPVTAAFGIKALLGKAHQKLVATSIIRSAIDRFQHKVTTSPGAIEGTGYQGRKRIRTDPASPRHGMLDGVEADANGQWNLPARQIGNRTLPAITFSYPREQVDNPAEWSNSQMSVEWLFINDAGQEEWR